MATVEESQELESGSNQPAIEDEQTELALTSSREEEAHSVQEEDGRPALADPEWIEERFRIDRKKLETMLHSPDNENSTTGEEFFQKVMMETNTQIKWPSKLKIGAKSKKDPHVKVEGKRNNVLEAKKKILDILETKVNKVTLKMDVAYTEHSHVIGKGGGNIKKVMEETLCHIHFPDSNRNSVNVEKSNQVSIAGPVCGVESARRKIRELQPLVLSFDLPVGIVPQTLPDLNSPLIQQVAQTFNVTVTFQQQPKIYTTTCTVRGLQGSCASVKKAMSVLVEILVGVETSVTVSTQLNISSQQHLFLIGQNGANFINIMQATQTQIVLPDLNSPQSRATLLIQGTTDAVCLAKQQLLDCLPVCLMFDMKEDGVEVEPRKLSQMMHNLGVFISVKPRVKQTAKSVVVKTLERNAANLYETRRLLLGLETSEVPTTVKPTPDVPLTNSLTNYWLNLIAQQLGLFDAGAVVTPEAVVSALLQVKSRPSPPPGLGLQHEESRGALKGNENKLWEKISGTELRQSSSGSEKPRTESSEPEEQADGLTWRSSQLEIHKDHNQGEGESATCQAAGVQKFIQSLFKGDADSDNAEIISNLKTDNLQNLNEDYDYEKKKLLATRAMQKKPVVTEVRTPTDTWSGLGFSKSMPAEAVKELRAVSRRNYKSYLSNNNSQTWALHQSLSKDKVASGSNSENWRERRESAPSFQPVTSNSMTSSSSSSSFPTFAGLTMRSRADKSTESLLSCSNYFESVSSLSRPGSLATSLSPPHSADLPELFSQLGLGKYIDVFQQQEIDFQTFLTLSDEDLKEVGISTFGARRKMLLAISELTKTKKKLLDPPTVKSGYLEGGASGRLPRIVDIDVAGQSNCW
ncbi:bicaudal C homolog 2 [Amia ocellicauda]|uniref:bicaudal C homolog 2 n=1 Tax=Amia ocellicauda TaxID=2972642 RepID=UPI003463BB89